MITVELKPTPATIKAAQFAVDVQDACNGLGVMLSLIDHIRAMAAEQKELFGTDLRNQHPVTIAVLDKLCSLARTQSNDEDGRIGDAHESCIKLAKGELAQWSIYPL